MAENIPEIKEASILNLNDLVKAIEEEQLWLLLQLVLLDAGATKDLLS